MMAKTELRLMKKLDNKNTDPNENKKRKVHYQMEISKLKHIKRIENICHISDLVYEFSFVEHG